MQSFASSPRVHGSSPYGSSHRALFVSLAVLCLGLFGVGCGKPYQILHQTTPNPFVGKTDFVVLPIDYSDLHIGEKSEAEYVSGKSEKSGDSFQGDKDGMNDKFQQSLQGASASAGLRVQPASGVVQTFLVKPHVYFIEPGFFTMIVNGPSKVEMDVTITDQHGAELDQIRVHHGTNSGMFNPASGQRLRSDADALGDYVAQYLIDRTHPEK